MTTFQYIMAGVAGLGFLMGIIIHAAVIVRIVTRLQVTVENLVKMLDTHETAGIQRHERINNYFVNINEHLNKVDVIMGKHEARLDEGDKRSNDHESRIRQLERTCAKCQTNDKR